MCGVKKERAQRKTEVSGRGENRKDERGQNEGKQEERGEFPPQLVPVFSACISSDRNSESSRHDTLQYGPCVSAQVLRDNTAPFDHRCQGLRETSEGVLSSPSTDRPASAEKR